MNLLVIEDDVRTAGYIAAAFRQIGNHVACETDGRTGYERVASGAFDVLVVDIMLPSMDGLEIVRRLRADGFTAPVLILSARASAEEKIAGLEAGADDYLAKPFSVAELVARVQTVLRRVNRSVESVLRAGDLEMNLVTHRVTRGGAVLDLQPLEYQLLEYLLRNRGRVVARKTIMESVWHYSFDPSTNVVETRMSRLRDKIETDPRCRLIRTVRGVGYVLA
ncbi:MAG: response regulator transcription factor [Kiritimatiellae bacterium]|nr:response regulator transcription factor [Kiritimatiellia bacterium]